MKLYLAGLLTLPVLWLVLTVGSNLLSITLRAMYDTQTIMRGNWKMFRHAPGVWAERLGKQWEAWRGGYEICAVAADGDNTTDESRRSQR